MKRLALIALLAVGACTRTSDPIPDWTIPPQQNLHVIFQVYDFRGEIAVSGGEWDGWQDVGDRARKPVHDANWPWASVTKQVVATLVMQQVEAGALSLDTPASAHLDWPTAFPAPTIRQLLQHQSGLANPDDSPEDADGFPSAYAEGVTDKYCLLEMSPPGGEGWRYNNCDYVMLGDLLEAVTGESIDALIRTRIAAPAGWTDTRLLGRDEMRYYYGHDETYDRRIAGYGSSAALVGPLRDIIAFDRALVSGKLLSDEARVTMWKGNPALGFMALGQWSFEAPLAGCDAPVRIVERRGGIGKYQVRNIMLPDTDIAVAIATAEEDFEFGEIWTGQGFMHDTLSAIACA